MRGPSYKSMVSALILFKQPVRNICNKQGRLVTKNLKKLSSLLVSLNHGILCCSLLVGKLSSVFYIFCFTNFFCLLVWLTFVYICFSAYLLPNYKYLNVIIFNWLFKKYFLYMFFFYLNMYVCAPHMYLGPADSRKGIVFPGNWAIVSCVCHVLLRVYPK